MAKKDALSDDLRRIYQIAQEEGYWIKEFSLSEDDVDYCAAAGSIKTLGKIEQETGQKIDINRLELSDLIFISQPGSGSTREEACLNALNAYKKLERSRKN
ncbi:MAG TPA: hypothetical protein VJB13_04800 [Candidatus Nanoarchaeia archaeon]|nr:hypothetical protein [Candidatus Nanoarchaeia archaeon]